MYQNHEELGVIIFVEFCQIKYYGTFVVQMACLFTDECRFPKYFRRGMPCSFCAACTEYLSLFIAQWSILINSSSFIQGFAIHLIISFSLCVLFCLQKLMILSYNIPNDWWNKIPFSTKHHIVWSTFIQIEDKFLHIAWSNGIQIEDKFLHIAWSTVIQIEDNILHIAWSTVIQIEDTFLLLAWSTVIQITDKFLHIAWSTVIQIKTSFCT